MLNHRSLLALSVAVMASASSGVVGSMQRANRTLGLDLTTHSGFNTQRGHTLVRARGDAAVRRLARKTKNKAKHRRACRS